jgi:hypothetical protein
VLTVEAEEEAKVPVKSARKCRVGTRYGQDMRVNTKQTHDRPRASETVRRLALRADSKAGHHTHTHTLRLIDRLATLQRCSTIGWTNEEHLTDTQSVLTTDCIGRRRTNHLNNGSDRRVPTLLCTWLSARSKKHGCMRVSCRLTVARQQSVHCKRGTLATSRLLRTAATLSSETRSTTDSVTCAKRMTQTPRITRRRHEHKCCLARKIAQTEKYNTRREEAEGDIDREGESQTKSKSSVEVVAARRPRLLLLQPS